jgi:hypothetical protein
MNVSANLSIGVLGSTYGAGRHARVGQGTAAGQPGVTDRVRRLNSITRDLRLLLLGLALACCACPAAVGDVVYEVTSPYHNIRVVDHDGMRTLCFDDATETRMSIQDPLKGHFEYTEYFHMPWL